MLPDAYPKVASQQRGLSLARGDWGITLGNQFGVICPLRP